MDKIFDRETYIEDLLRQEKILQNIEQYSNGKLEFMDIADAHDALQGKIRDENLLETIKQHSSDGLDFGDVIDAHASLVRIRKEEQRQLRKLKQKYLQDTSTETAFVQGEREQSPSSGLLESNNFGCLRGD
jgi:hypothetical protein